MGNYFNNVWIIKGGIDFTHCQVRGQIPTAESKQLKRARILHREHMTTHNPHKNNIPTPGLYNFSKRPIKLKCVGNVYVSLYRRNQETS